MTASTPNLQSPGGSAKGTSLGHDVALGFLCLAEQPLVQVAWLERLRQLGISATPHLPDDIAAACRMVEKTEMAFSLAHLASPTQVGGPLAEKVQARVVVHPPLVILVDWTPNDAERERLRQAGGVLILDPRAARNNDTSQLPEFLLNSIKRPPSVRSERLGELLARAGARGDCMVVTVCCAHAKALIAHPYGARGVYCQGDPDIEGCVGCVGRLYIEDQMITFAEGPRSVGLAAVAELINYRGGIARVSTLYVKPITPNLQRDGWTMQEQLIAALKGPFEPTAGFATTPSAQSPIPLAELSIDGTTGSPHERDTGDVGTREGTQEIDPVIDHEAGPDEGLDAAPRTTEFAPRPTIELASNPFEEPPSDAHARTDRVEPMAPPNVAAQVRSPSTLQPRRDGSDVRSSSGLRPASDVALPGESMTERLLRVVPGLRGAAAIDARGNVTEFTGVMDAEMVGAIATMSASNFVAVGGFIQMGAPRGWSMVTDRFTLYVHVSGENLIVATGESSNAAEATHKRIGQLIERPAP